MRDFFQEYREWASRPSDFNEHMPTVFNLADGITDVRITEFGVGFGQSTRAFLAALDGDGFLRSYDIRVHDGIPELFHDAENANLDAKFILDSTLDCEIEETDILLIDSLHVYDQVKGELRDSVVNKVSQFLIFHDTETFGINGELPGSRGILPAINEFLTDHPEWNVYKRYTNNNGLLILKRD